MHRVGSILIIGLLAVASACSKDAAPPAPNETTTRASFIAAYEEACTASVAASAELEQPTADGGTFPPSPPADALPAWGEWARGLEEVQGALVEDLRAIPVPAADAEAAADLVALRETNVEVIALIAAGAENGDSGAFSEAYTEWVAAGHDAGVAEESFGIRCDA